MVKPMKMLSKNHLLFLILPLTFGSNAFARNHLLVNNPIDSISGLQNVEYSYKFADNWTTGITITYADHYKSNGIALKGSSFSGVSRYYFQPVFQSDAWFLMAAANKTNYEASITSGGNRYSGKGENSITAGGGYHWFWESFNVSAGALISTPPKIQLKDAAGIQYKDELSPHLGIEIKVGGSF